MVASGMDCIERVECEVGESVSLLAVHERQEYALSLVVLLSVVEVCRHAVEQVRQTLVDRIFTGQDVNWKKA